MRKTYICNNLSCGWSGKGWVRGPNPVIYTTKEGKSIILFTIESPYRCPECGFEVIEMQEVKNVLDRIIKD